MKLIVVILFLLGIPVNISYSQAVEKKVIVAPQFQSLFDTSHMVTINNQFDISLYYIGGLKRPRFMAMGPNNVLYVADMDGNHIFAIKDTNADGIGDTAIAVTPSVDTAHSLAFYQRYLFVAEPSRVRKFEDLDGDGFYETEHPFISGIGSVGVYNHFTRTIYIDSSEGYIYLGVGASCNACRESDSERASVLRFNLDGSGRMVYASGLRNALGVAKGPFGDIWVTNADRDNLDDYIPPEIITHVHKGGFYGWPFAYGNHEWIDFLKAPEYQAILPITAEDSLKVAGMETADIYLPAHSTPMEIMNYLNAPTAFNKPAFIISIHGSSKGGKSIGTGYKVISAQYIFTTKQWVVFDLVSGFLTDSITYNYWARPCGLAEDSVNKVIYLSSDAGTPAIFKLTLKEINRVPSSRSNTTAMKVFPNPAHSSFTIESSDLSPSTKIELFDLLGRTISCKYQIGSAGIRVEPIIPIPPSVIYCRISSQTIDTIMPIMVE